MQLPDSIFFSFLTLTFALVIVLLVGLKKVMQRANYDKGKQQKVLLFTFLGVLAWLLILTGLAVAGFFSDFDAMPPRVPVAVVPPLLIGFLILSRPKVKALLTHMPPSWAIYPQVFRVPLELILWGMLVTGIGPVQMTFEGYNFDILSGISAPIIAWLVFHKKVLPKGIAIVWNFIGLTLVAVIVTIAVLSFPIPGIQYFMEEPSNRAVAFWPLIWLPGFVVPLAVWLHVVSLKQLFAKTP